MDRRRLRLPTFEQMDAKVRAGDWQCHAFKFGFVISEVRKYDFEQVLVVHLLSGERFGEWAEECVQHLREFATAHDCCAIEALCRPGLAELLKGIGWRTRNVEVRLNLTESGAKREMS